MKSLKTVGGLRKANRAKDPYRWKASKRLPSALSRVPRITIKQTNSSQQVVLLVDT